LNANPFNIYTNNTQRAQVSSVGNIGVAKVPAAYNLIDVADTQTTLSTAGYNTANLVSSISVAAADTFTHQGILNSITYANSSSASGVSVAGLGNTTILATVGSGTLGAIYGINNFLNLQTGVAAGVSTTSAYGIENSITSATPGTISSLAGTYNNLILTNSSATYGNVYGTGNILSLVSGTVNTVYGDYVSVTGTSAAVTNLYGHYITISGATATNSYGLYIANLTTGSTAMYAIYSSSAAPSALFGRLGVGKPPAANVEVDVLQNETTVSASGYVGINQTSTIFLAAQDTSLISHNGIFNTVTYSNSGGANNNFINLMTGTVTAQNTTSGTFASVSGITTTVMVPSSIGSSVGIGNVEGLITQVNAGTSGNIGNCFGTNTSLLVSGTGTYSNMAVSYNTINSNASGLINICYGELISLNFATQPITTLYGLYISTIPSSAVVNSYGIYISGLAPGSTTTYSIYNNSTAPSYFAGNVGINQTATAYNLDINGTMRLQNTAVTTGTGTYNTTGLGLSSSNQVCTQFKFFSTVSTSGGIVNLTFTAGMFGNQTPLYAIGTCRSIGAGATQQGIFTVSSLTSSGLSGYTTTGLTLAALGNTLQFIAGITVNIIVALF